MLTTLFYFLVLEQIPSRACVRIFGTGWRSYGFADLAQRPRRNRIRDFMRQARRAVLPL